MVQLLTDEDPEVYRLVRQRIVAGGPGVATWLKPHTLSSDAQLRKRASEIITHFDRQSADTEFLCFCLSKGKVFDLELAALLLARTRDPGISVEGYGALLDVFARSLSERLKPKCSDMEVWNHLHEHFFYTLRFKPVPRQSASSDGIFLNSVIDRRMGDAASLCLIYHLIARRLGLPVSLVSLPGQMVCRYQSITAEMYIDVFNRGLLMTKADCVEYLRSSAGHEGDAWSRPVCPRKYLLKMCQNLVFAGRGLNSDEESLRLKRYVVALSH